MESIEIPLYEWEMDSSRYTAKKFQGENKFFLKTMIFFFNLVSKFLHVKIRMLPSPKILRTCQQVVQKIGFFCAH